MNSRIIALNVPARVHQEIAGNPVSSRPESGVANCWPGLEIDVRNLDRRFFPGLIFEFTTSVGPAGDTRKHGAQLVKIESEDPDIPDDARYRRTLRILEKRVGQGELLFLSAITQGKKCIRLWSKQKGRIQWFDDIVVWRLVRSLRPGEVKIELARRVGRENGARIALTGNRRTYQRVDGSLSEVFRAGELGQSLCSPWQHDFRDCTCNYWASNHPDISMPAHPATIAQRLAPGQRADQAERPLMWLRRNLNSIVRPPATALGCREFEMDHYQLNRLWEALPFVLEQRETSGVYSIGLIEYAEPLPAERLEEELRDLARMEHALAVEYLYARCSVAFSEIKTPTTKPQEYAQFISHELLAIAVSEMMHLRWANQLLWELWHEDPRVSFKPSLGIAATVPSAAAPVRGKTPSDAMIVERPPQCQPLDKGIQNFLAAERNSGTLEGRYARIYSLLRTGYPPQLRELVSRIIADGVSHYSRFRRIDAILRYHQEPAGRHPLIRSPFKKLPLTSDQPKLGQIRKAYATLLLNLHKAFRSGDAEDRKFITEARIEMHRIDELSLELAQDGHGVPFVEIAREAAADFE